MTIRQTMFFLLFLFLPLLFPYHANATVQPARSLKQMIQEAAQIIQGKILSKRTFWGKKKRYIYTEIKMQVVAYLKGRKSRSKRFAFHKIGGQIGQTILRVPGTATYELNEEVVIFVEPKRHPVYRFVLGMAAGKYRVFRRDGKTYLYRNTQGLAFHQIPKGEPLPKSVAEKRHSEAPLSLKKLQTFIQQQRKNATKQLYQLKPMPTKRYLSYLQMMRYRSKKPHRIQQKKRRHSNMGQFLQPQKAK